MNYNKQSTEGAIRTRAIDQEAIPLQPAEQFTNTRDAKVANVRVSLVNKRNVH